MHKPKQIKQSQLENKKRVGQRKHTHWGGHLVQLLIHCLGCPHAKLECLGWNSSSAKRKSGKRGYTLCSNPLTTEWVRTALHSAGNVFIISQHASFLASLDSSTFITLEKRGKQHLHKKEGRRWIQPKTSFLAKKKKMEGIWGSRIKGENLPEEGSQFCFLLWIQNLKAKEQKVKDRQTKKRETLALLPNWVSRGVPP